MKVKRTLQDNIIDIVIFGFSILFIFTIIYPLLNALAVSFNFADDTTKGGITIFPRVPTLRNYELIFTNPDIYQAYFITIARTVIGTVAGLFMTAIISFGLAHSNLVGRKFYTYICLIPMYFSGGLIPFYLMVKGFGLTDNFLVYIIPQLVGLWNMILMRSYFATLPAALEESARIDGANYLTTFFKIIFPLSTPIFATVALYIGVMQWNSWYDAFLFINKRADLKPMQSVLLSIINQAAYAERIASLTGGGGAAAAAAGGNATKGKMVNVRSITMATMIVTILPIVCVYPFLQKYFIKGVMIGSIKG